jgi:hypothetical protein
MATRLPLRRERLSEGERRSNYDPTTNRLSNPTRRSVKCKGFRIALEETEQDLDGSRRPVRSLVKWTREQYMVSSLNFGVTTQTVETLVEVEAGVVPADRCMREDRSTHSGHEIVFCASSF